MRALLCVSLISLLAAPMVLRANPKIIINKDPQNIIPITGLTWTFDSDKNGGGIFTFENESGKDFTSLDFFVTLPVGETITCTPSPFFSFCEQSSTPIGDGKADYDIGFDINPGGPTGIAPGEIFSIDLNTDNIGCGDWGSNNPFEVAANGVPEPASWLLFVGGAGLLGAAVFRAGRNNRAHIRS